MRVHLDTDFLIHAVSRNGPESRRLFELAASEADLQMSALAWYEFSRGPRTEQQIAVARSFFPANGIVPLSEEVAERAAQIYRKLGAPRRRGNDITIGVTAVVMRARLVTRNAADFAGIPDLDVEGAGNT